ncbi:hypothetical protein GCM10023322_42440 [Rugosimonospora acidiphila]|uniref:Uncharacterized protein n=1 Tax=Rugosimonospora acidiphila TaxID=556531 RepID=A0ABP9S1T8_9ACTN
MDAVSTSGSLRVVVRPHWVNACLLVPFARPYARIDGQEYTLRWKRPLRVDVAAGRHAVETFTRYRGASTALGTGRIEVEVGPDREVGIVARNGWMNHEPFRPEVRATGA